LIAAGVRRPYRHRKEVVEGQHVGKTRIHAKLSLGATLALSLALAACQIPSTYRPPLIRQQTAQASAAGPAPARQRVAPATAPRRLPGIRPVTREANFGSAEESALFRELRSNGLDAAHDGISIVLILGDDILFASGSSQLNPKAHTLLKAMASVLKRYGTMQIDVGGYTDTAGSAALNLRLSQQRAKAVADILMSEGLEAPRISTRGFGESFPRVPTRDGVSEPRNRRVEITLVPYTRES
jgi:outer membrane protein OmpA-like peptidoglycan-associated protein